MEWLCLEIVRAAEIALTTKKWGKWSHKNQLRLLQLRLRPSCREAERSLKDALIHAYIAVYIFIKKTLYCIEAAGHSQVVGVFFFTQFLSSFCLNSTGSILVFTRFFLCLTWIRGMIALVQETE